jgi:hypothetical protein
MTDKLDSISQAVGILLLVALFCKLFSKGWIKWQ